MSFEQTLIDRQVQQLGRGLRDEAVVVGSAAMALAFDVAGWPFRQVHDIDIAVTPDGYAYLRDQPEWEEYIEPNGACLLSNGICEVGAGWNGTSNHELRERDWQTAAGTRVASLADVHMHKQMRRLGKDAEDIETIRAELQDPYGAPLPVRVLAREINTARVVLPEYLQDADKAQPAIHLAANGLHIVNTLYGHPGIGKVGRIVAALEKPEYQVPATYHNGFNLPEDMRLLQRHFTNIGASDTDRLDGLVSDVYSDAIYGNGRYKDSPKGHDELLAARLLAGHGRQVGYSERHVARLRRAVLGTTFDEQAKTQRGKYDPDPVVRGICGVDLQILSEPGSAEACIDLAIEDGFSERSSSARMIGKVLIEHGIWVDSTLVGLEGIDAYGHLKPTDAQDGPTALQAFVHKLLGNARFHEEHEYPYDWTLDNPALRRDHAVFLRQLSGQLTEGVITTVQAFALAKEHTVAMREKYRARDLFLD